MITRRRKMSKVRPIISSTPTRSRRLTKRNRHSPSQRLRKHCIAVRQPCAIFESGYSLLNSMLGLMLGSILDPIPTELQRSCIELCLRALENVWVLDHCEDEVLAVYRISWWSVAVSSATLALSDEEEELLEDMKDASSLEEVQESKEASKEERGGCRAPVNAINRLPIDPTR
ncbi:hypothetical protein EDB19DRAFT_1732597 [Suillus lakei]|nr:hypothetical protein EDB19DRAFT_1732597 [Suillus lakei]